MASSTSAITIARPIADVFAVLTDVEKTGEWFPVNVRETWTSPPPRGVGSTRHAVIRVLVMRTENDATVTAYDPPHRAVLEGRSAGMAWEVTLTCTPVEGGTRAEVGFAAAARGPMRLGIGPFLWVYRRYWERGLANLKRMMEAGEL